MNIELKGVNFTYPDTIKGALTNINLKIEQGEFVLLVGESGCGKTTITRVLNGLIPSFYMGNLEGEIYIGDRDIREFNSYELASIVGSIFQNPRTQFFNVDTDSELAFGMENACKSSKEINSVIEKVTRELKIKRLRARNIFELSGGEKQKIAFASVYASDPNIYLMDEPSANLDTSGIIELKKCMEKIKAQGKTVIIAEHRLYYLASLVDRVIYLRNGQIEREISGDDFRLMSTETLNNMGLRSNSYARVHAQNNVRCGYDNGIDGLCLQGVSVDLGGRRVLNNINRKFSRGRICCVAGENGVGKSTLLRTLCGLVRKNSGNIMLDGKELSARELRKMAFMVMQDVNYQLFADSVFNECILGAPKKISNNIEELLDEMGLLAYRDCHPNTLSGGQKQRLAIVVSIMMNKDILLFDEPTSGLDYKNMLTCVTFLRKLSDMGKIVIVVTHDEEFMNCCCDELYSLNPSPHPIDNKLKQIDIKTPI
ncbi:MAG: ABC transporter ATP-binding protein [Pseudobutyrivibrio sp.]|nr:ABC transporter ATP-binding protein [Pseudobutyrivibrio sp.]